MKSTDLTHLLLALPYIWIVSFQISETGLIDILEKVSQQTEKKTTVKVSPRIKYNITISDRLNWLHPLSSPQFNRRKVMDSDDEDDDWCVERSSGASQTAGLGRDSGLDRLEQGSVRWRPSLTCQGPCISDAPRDITSAPVCIWNSLLYSLLYPFSPHFTFSPPQEAEQNST